MKTKLLQIMLIFVAGVIVSSASAQTWTMVDDADAAITYAGSWFTQSYPTAYNGTVHYCETSGATASYTFTGTKVRVYLWQYDTSQAMDAYIDEEFQQTISLGSGSEASIMAYESGALANASHTIRIEYASGEPHFDAFEYEEGGAPDTTPPTPDPMTWASVPAAGGTDNISMTATTASDPSGVEYLFDETSGNPGGSDSSWQASTSYTDSGLNAGTQYCYQVKARDQSANQNETAWSTNECATTDAPDTTPPSPDPMTWAIVPYATGDVSIAMEATTATDPSGVEYYFMETSANPGGSDSGWQDSTAYSDIGLNSGMQYCYEVQARDKSVNQNATAWSTNQCATTTAPDTTPPTPDPMTWATVPYATGSSSIAMVATTATDLSDVEYYFDETTGGPGGSDSGWQDSTSYEDTGLSPETTYTYQVKARDKSAAQNETAYSTAESATTDAGPVGTEFYVAPGGNDGGAGTIGDPWATLNGARLNVQPLLDGTDDITVYFRDGTYTLSSTVVFNLSDDGTANQSITYAAYPGETPILSSLVQVTGWTTHSGSIMRANLPGGISSIRFLQDSRASVGWLPRSATDNFRPTESISGHGAEACENPECLTGDSGEQTWKTKITPIGLSASPDWSKVSQYDIRVIQESWNVDIYPLASRTDSQLNLAIPSNYPLLEHLECQFCVEGWIINSIAGIGTAGEWACIDGVVYLYPVGGNTDNIYAPQLTELVKVDAGGNGNTYTGSPVQYINFDGITFTGGDYYPTGPAGSLCTMHDWGVVDQPASLLRYRNAANCQITNCTFEKSGSGGLRLDRIAQNFLIDGNVFDTFGRECLIISGRGIGYGDVNFGNTVTNNLFARSGREKWDSPAVNLSQTSSNTFMYNVIEDTYHTGMHMTSSRPLYWEWSSIPGGLFRENLINEVEPGVAAIFDSIPEWEAAQWMYTHDNVIEKNVFTNLHHSADSSDNHLYTHIVNPSNGAAFYHTGAKEATTNYLQYNYFHSIRPWASTQLLYTDTCMDYFDCNYNFVVQNPHSRDTAEDLEVSFDLNTFFQDGPAPYALGRLNGNYYKGNGAQFFSSTPETWNPRQEIGNMDYDHSGGNNPSASLLSNYEAMYCILVNNELPGGASLPGRSTAITDLANVINGYGGSTDCGPTDTDPPTPDPMTWASVPTADDHDSISMTATTATDVSGVEYYFDETTGGPGGSDSGWQDPASYTDTGLNGSTQYCYEVTARDKSANQNETAPSSNQCATTDVTPDTTPPTPDPATWASVPAAGGTDNISMTATTATDPSGVEYYFDETSGNPGGSDSGWQDPASYTDTGLSASTQYCYEVQARDKSANQNATGWSTNQCATTDAIPDTDPPTPDPMTWASVPSADSDTQISMTATTATDPSGVEYYFDETSGNPGGSDSGWQASASYTDTGLSASTQYCYQVRARDLSVNQNATAWSTNQCATTQAAPDTTPPSPDPATWAAVPAAGGTDNISMTATTGSDPSGVEYFFDETSANPGGSDSGWQAGTGYTDTGLSASTQYCYQVRARDLSVNQNATAWSTNECATTEAPPPDTTPPTPDPMTWASVPAAGGTDNISMTATTATDPSGVEYFFDETSGNAGGTDSSWQTSTSYTDSGLSESTQYCYQVRAHDLSVNQNATAWSTNECATTDSIDCHVEALVCSEQKCGGPNRNGVATVTIYDELGAPVVGADVTGTFTGDFNETLTETTDGNGQAVLVTAGCLKKPTFQFCVDDVVASIPYDSNDNLVTCCND